MPVDVVRVPRVVRNALDKTELAQQPIPLEEHLSVSQHLQCLLDPAVAQKLKLQQNMGTQQPNVAALCINHALRMESQYECQHAASQAAAMGLQPDIMQMEWLEKPRQGRLMQTASINRYLLLHKACKAKTISVLLTGHHAGEHKSCGPAYFVDVLVMQQILALFHAAHWCLWNYIPVCPYTRLHRHADGECVYPGDQAENLMIRASRGSGIAGLASISEASWSFLGTCLPQATAQLHTWPFDLCTALAPYYCSSLQQEEVHCRSTLPLHLHADGP